MTVETFVPGAMPQQLLEYWVHGKGAAKIRWGVPGDFNRCVRALRKYFPTNPEGLCNRLHTRALGVPPGQEHALEGKPFRLQLLDAEGNPVGEPFTGTGTATFAVAEADLDVPDAEWEELYATLPTKKMWRGRLAPIGVPTGDRRRFEVGALSSRDLPLPLQYQLQSAEGHQRSVVVGRILGAEFRDDEVWGYGDWLDTEHTYAAQQRLESGLGGVSVDLDDVEMQTRVPGSDQAWLETEQCSMETGQCSPYEHVVTKGRLSAATIVAIPAFAEAKLEMYDAVDEDALMAMLDKMAAEPGAESCGCGMSAAALVEACKPLTAAAAPTAFTPPLAAFGDPGLDRLSGLRMDDQRYPGYTYVCGYVAPWNLPHLGQAHRTAPRSRSGYSYFHLHPVYTAEGEEIHVGKITFGGTHPSLEAGLTEAMHHYDVATDAVAVVRVGEDARGIWFAGVLLPHVDETTRVLLSVSPLSGDWRPVGSRTNLEMIAALSVNVPGFPIVTERQERGQTVALVASCGAPTEAQEEHGLSYDETTGMIRVVVNGAELFLRPTPHPTVEADAARREAAADLMAEFIEARDAELAYREALMEELAAGPGHDSCEVEDFCRNPLHPGPCKGTPRAPSAPKQDRGPVDRHGGWDPDKKRYLKPSGTGYYPKGWQPNQGAPRRRRRLHSDEDVRRRMAE